MEPPVKKHKTGGVSPVMQSQLTDETNKAITAFREEPLNIDQKLDPSKGVTFDRFPDLPNEIQQMIWRATLPSKRIINFERRDPWDVKWEMKHLEIGHFGWHKKPNLEDARWMFESATPHFTTLMDLTLVPMDPAEFWGNQAQIFDLFHDAKILNSCYEKLRQVLVNTNQTIPKILVKGFPPLEEDVHPST
ncbi:hypothetical protein G7Y89_g9034 [Cudoniella acicularis]|uniref:2EXR domain-containing protein n=1 Tax=Cudoniella acicularis TaxID=354080 RepID=A0A8H4W2Z8_9HELO|nr:hypothetical protein G7Y89_g9034 [Cudoniella acicularis]